MKSFLAYDKLTAAQNSLYCKLNNFSNKHPILGRLGAIPVCIIDVGLDTFKIGLAAIEQVGLAAINLLGAAFHSKCSLKEALNSTEHTFSLVASFSIRVFFIPAKLGFQFLAIVINPQKVQSIDFNKATYIVT